MEKGTILKKPIVTEKTSRLREGNHYVVEVALKATKGEIRQALEKRFRVSILSIKTMTSPGKYRRRTGPIGGYQADRKKAIVKVKQGQQITWEEVS